MNGGVRLPHFERPPVAQVVIGVVFEPLLRLRASHVGLFWGEINANNEYPVVEEFPASRSTVEDFGSKEASRNVDAELLVQGQESLPRIVYSAEDTSLQIAIQRDALQIGWRRVSNKDYPRFEAPRDLFQDIFTRFSKFLETHKLGRMRLRQAEVSYLNALPVRSAEVATDTESLVKFRLVNGEKLPPTDHFHIIQGHNLPDSSGNTWARLYITVDSNGYDDLEQKENGDTSKSARFGLAVLGPARDEDEVFDFLEKGHDVIVTSFVSTMTPLGEVQWGKLGGES